MKAHIILQIILYTARIDIEPPSSAEGMFNSRLPTQRISFLLTFLFIYLTTAERDVQCEIIKSIWMIYREYERKRLNAV